MINLIFKSADVECNILPVLDTGVELRILEYLRNEIMQKVIANTVAVKNGRETELKDLVEDAYYKVKQELKDWIFQRVQKEVRNKSVLFVIGDECNRIELVDNLTEEGSEFLEQLIMNNPTMWED